MPELVLTNNETGKDETFNTDDFGEDAKMRKNLNDISFWQQY